MKRLLLSIMLMYFSLVASSALSQDEDLVAEGRLNYEHKCAPCHDRGPGSDGTPLMPAPSALTIKYNGALSPYISERSDLANVEVLRVFVRGGTVSMPPFRKTELTDHELEAIAAFFKVEAARVAEENL